MAEKKVSVRFTAQGGREIRSEMEGLGAAGVAAFEKIDRGSKSAADSADVFAKTIAEEDRAFRALRASLDPAYAAEVKYKAAVESASRAVKQGAATQTQANAVILRAREEMQETTRRVAAMQAEVRRSGAGFGAMRGQVQNASFQIADFATQVSGGASASTALAFQLPQLVAGFGAAGAAAGAVIAVGVPLAKWLMDTEKEARTLSGQIDALSASMSDLSAAQEAASAGNFDLFQRFGRDIEQGRKLLEIQKDIAELAAQRDLGASYQLLAKGLGDFSDLGDVGAQLQKLEHYRAELQEIRKSLLSPALFQDNSGIVARQQELESFLAANADAERQLNDLAKTFDVSTEAAIGLASAVADFEQAKGVQEAAAAASALAVKIFDATDGLRNASDETLELYKSLVQAAITGNEFSATDLSSGVKEAAAQAEVLANNLLASAHFAEQLKRTGATEKQPSLGFGLPSVGDPSVGDATLGFGKLTPGARRPAIDLTPPTYKGSRGGGGGGGGGISDAVREAQAIDRVVSGLQDEVALFHATDEARRLHQELQKAGVDLYSTEGQQIADLVEQLTQMEAHQKATEELRQGIASISDAMAQAIVRGEDMGEALSAVFADIAQNLVSSGINSLMGGLFGSFGFGGFGGGHAALAGATGGSLVSYAGGGYTGDGARSGGLDGMGGFLAMMHPRETVTDHARGQRSPGSGGTVRLIIEEAPGFAARVRTEAQGVAVQVVQANNRMLPYMIADYERDPRRRG